MRERLENMAIPVGHGHAPFGTILGGGCAVLITFVMALQVIRGDFGPHFYYNALFAVVLWLTFLRFLGTSLWWQHPEREERPVGTGNEEPRSAPDEAVTRGISARATIPRPK